MVYRGYVRQGKIELSDATSLPEGAEVELSIIRAPMRDGNALADSNGVRNQPAAWELELDRIWDDVPESEWDRLPSDLTNQLDHYIYGTPKK